eukprot:TRINITY_DN17698_c0_g1_i2.p2 TRINITY_DN17698_c0_g1~~TRINITY_DN17698_c0_g1_i2.p2  ORF type:complete len:121 (-),score=3.60 TRINITY_DN17698_c0_g1_i2:166-528(-)
MCIRDRVSTQSTGDGATLRWDADQEQADRQEERRGEIPPKHSQCQAPKGCFACASRAGVFWPHGVAAGDRVQTLLPGHIMEIHGEYMSTSSLELLGCGRRLRQSFRSWGEAVSNHPPSER